MSLWSFHQWLHQQKPIQIRILALFENTSSQVQILIVNLDENINYHIQILIVSLFENSIIQI